MGKDWRVEYLLRVDFIRPFIYLYFFGMNHFFFFRRIIIIIFFSNAELFLRGLTVPRDLSNLTCCDDSDLFLRELYSLCRYSLSPLSQNFLSSLSAKTLLSFSTFYFPFSYWWYSHYLIDHKNKFIICASWTSTGETPLFLS